MRMPITLKILLGITVLRIAAFVIFDILILVFLFYHPDSGFLSSLRFKLAERQIGIQDYGFGLALNAVAIISIGAVLLAPVVAAMKSRSRKWVTAAGVSLVLLFLSNIFRIRLYSVILDVISLLLFFTRGSRAYLSDNVTEAVLDIEGKVEVGKCQDSP